MTTLTRRQFLAAPLAATLNVAIKVAPPIGGRGPQPLSSPYPLQPGFTAISDLSAMTTGGRYQLVNDINTPNMWPTVPAGGTLDAGGHNIVVGGLYVSGGAILKNGNVTGSVMSLLGGDGLSLVNNTIYLRAPQGEVAGTAIIQVNNATIVNNLIKGDYNGYSLGTDDCLLLYCKDTSTTMTNINISGNVFSGSFDCGVELVGNFAQCQFLNNSFDTTGACIGGWYDANRGGDFRFSDCTFRGNMRQQSSTTVMYNFYYDRVDDDATANQKWGQSSTVNSLAYDNTFSGSGLY